MTDIGLLAALAAGVLALLSPCSALLLPSFFAYAFTSRSSLVARTSVFYLGLLITLVPLGTGAALASQVFYGHRELLITVSGWVIVALGVFQVLGGSFAVPFADRLQGWAGRHGRGGDGSGGGASGGDGSGGDADGVDGNGRAARRGGYLSTLVLGAVYGLAGFCSGPVLGAILTLAATRSNPLGGALLLAVYALGMALPLFVLAAFWDRFRLGERRWLRGRMLHVGPVTVHSTALVSGLLFIAIGALFLRFDGTAGIVGLLGLGDTTDLEVNAQNAVTEVTAGFPVWALPAAVAVIAAGVALNRALRR